MARAGNMTQGVEWKHLLKFALPLMAGNALQQLYNTVDGIIVGNFVNDTALAGVGACAPLTMVFIALAIGMSNGSAVVTISAETMELDIPLEELLAKAAELPGVIKAEVLAG